MTIELRLTDIDPPIAEPKRTIYRDIANLPDPTTLGITARYFNFDDVDLYMQLTGAATGYTFTPVNIGLLATGTNAYRNFDNLASRAKPTVAQLPNGEMTENITLTLKAYTDAGYTNLKWTFNRVVTVIWINSADAAFTVNELDNFDDGTVQGWSAVPIIAGSAALTVVSDYVLSVPYSLKMTQTRSGGATSEAKSSIQKDFTTPNKNEVYAIIDIRITNATDIWSKNASVLQDSVTLIFLGRPYDTVFPTTYISATKWLRIVVPLPKNTALTLKIIIDTFIYYPHTTWMDDFKIISK